MTPVFPCHSHTETGWGNSWKRRLKGMKEWRNRIKGIWSHRLMSALEILSQADWVPLTPLNSLDLDIAEVETALDVLVICFKHGLLSLTLMLTSGVHLGFPIQYLAAWTLGNGLGKVTKSHSSYESCQIKASFLALTWVMILFVPSFFQQIEGGVRGMCL